MARTLKVTATLENLTTGAFVGVENKQITTTGDLSLDREIDVGTTEVEVPLDGIGNAGLCAIRHIGTTNFVDVGFATGNYPLRLYPGEPNVLSLKPTQASLFLKADTAAEKMQIRVQER